MKKILSISGGGMRGVIPGRFLVEIEKRTGKPIAETFDLVSGTSTGSILAALAVTPKIVTARDALRFYYDSGPRIFKRGWFDFGVFGPKYSSKDLARELRECIGDAACKDATRKAIIPTVDANRIEAEFIKTWDSYYSDFPLWAAAAASSSAQTFFPAFNFEYRRQTHRYLDGGNHTNNPAASAMFEAYRLWPAEPLLIIHLGTGKQRNPKPLPDGGIARWAPLVFGTTSECQDDCASYYCTHAPGVTFLPFDVSIDRFPAMDASDTRTLDCLVDLVVKSIDGDSDRWEQLTALLKS